MKKSAYGKRIALGALLVGYMSTASSLIIEKKYPLNDNKGTPVSLGYDRIRFIKPVFIDELITVKYFVEEFDLKSIISRSQIEITNQHNELVAVATHILTWVQNTSDCPNRTN